MQNSRWLFPEEATVVASLIGFATIATRGKWLRPTTRWATAAACASAPSVGLPKRAKKCSRWPRPPRNARTTTPKASWVRKPLLSQFGWPDRAFPERRSAKILKRHSAMICRSTSTKFVHTTHGKEWTKKAMERSVATAFRRPLSARSRPAILKMPCAMR